MFYPITASLIILNGDVNEKRQSEVECSVVGPVFFLFFVFFFVLMINNTSRFTSGINVLCMMFTCHFIYLAF